MRLGGPSGGLESTLILLGGMREEEPHQGATAVYALGLSYLGGGGTALHFNPEP